MVWNLSVSHSELELITWVLREAKVGDCAPLEQLLRFIKVRRWLDISGRGRDDDRAMDGVCGNLALV